MLVVQIVVIGTSLVEGGWFSDDLYNAEIAHGAPLGWAFMSRGFFGHFLPLAQVPLWWAGHLLLHHTRVMLCELGLILVTTALFAVLLRRILGPRPVLVLSLTLFFALTPFTVPSYLWWAAAFEVVPAQLCVVVALLWYDAWLRRGRWPLAIGIGACVAVGICFWDLDNLLIVWLPAFALARSNGTLPQRLRFVWRSWPVWLAMVVPLAGYQWYYQSHHFAAPSAPPFGQLARYLGVGWSQGFVPGLLGGPLRWDFVGFGYFGITAAPTWFAVLAQMLLIALVVTAVRRNTRTWAAWVMILLTVGSALLLVALGRLGMSGSALGRDYRYLAITAAPVLVGLGMALDGAWPPVEQSGWRRTLARPAVRSGLALLCLGLLAELTTDVTYGHTWSTLRTDAYLSTFSADVRHLQSSAPGGTVTVLNENVPNWVFVQDFLGPNTSQISSVGPTVVTRGVQYDGTVTTLYRVNPQGHIVPAALVNAARLTSKRGCSKGTGQPELITLRTGFLLGPMNGYAVVLHLTANAPTRVYVRLRAQRKLLPYVDYDTATVPMPAGHHSVVFAEEGESFDTVELVVNSRQRVCVTSASASQLAPD